MQPLALSFWFPWFGSSCVLHHLRHRRHDWAPSSDFEYEMNLKTTVCSQRKIVDRKHHDLCQIIGREAVDVIGMQVRIMILVATKTTLG